MLLGFAYLYKFVMFYFLFYFKEQKIINLKKASWPKFYIFLFLFKIGLVRPVDQQINLVLPTVYNSHDETFLLIQFM